MITKIELTESEAQYMRELLLKQTKVLADILGDTEAEEYLKSIDKNHAYTIYQKLV